MGDVASSEPVLRPESLGGLRVYSAAEIEKPELCVVYSEPGVGKTPLVASGNRIAAFHPMLVIDCDDGPKSLRRRYPEVKVVSPRTLAELQGVWDDMLRGKAKKYRSIMLDGGSAIQYRGYEHLLGDSPMPGKPRRYQSMVKFDSPSWQNHGYQNSAVQMTVMVEIIKELQLRYEQHFFFTAWAKNVAKATKENPSPPDKWEPAFTPAVGDAIDGRFDSILYFYKERQNQSFVKKLRSAGDANVMCRDRDDRLPEVMVNPTMQLIAKAWGLDSSIVDLSE
jgi:hypothetical protein